VPSGVWAADEYDLLRRWDGDLAFQSPSTFGCHQADGSLCAGWVGHRDAPTELLAIRLGIAHEVIAPEVADYRTDVSLFSSGAQAAEHG
jgi:hypothetical protein